MSSGADVLKMIKDKKVKFVDFRFTDTKGKEQHVSVPAHTIEADTFEHGAEGAHDLPRLAVRIRAGEVAGRRIDARGA